ncbi:MAG TPA: hypothetical protein ENI80_03410 [Acidiferrobacteraceae bacterium]|nr:hypothetical protein [Acidiferrobacteraceae bacterium]
MKKLFIVMMTAMVVVLSGCGSVGKSKVISYKVGDDGKPSNVVESFKTNTLARAEGAAKTCGAEDKDKAHSGGWLVAEIPQANNAAPIKLYTVKDSAVVAQERQALVGCVTAFMETTGKVIANRLGDMGERAVSQFPLLCLVFRGSCGGGGSGTTIKTGDKSQVTYTNKSPTSTLSGGSKQFNIGEKSKGNFADEGSQSQQDVRSNKAASTTQDKNESDNSVSEATPAP